MAAVAAQAQQVKKPAATPKPQPVANSLKNATDSFSYAIGMNVANNLRQQGVENVNLIALQKGMSDVFDKKPLVCTDQQANTLIQAKFMEATKGKEIAFLAANKKRAGVIVLPSGLQYEVIKKGDANSATPRLQDTVVANYAGSLINGKEFDNSYKRGQPLTIPVGGVIKGWTEILQIMHIGDKFKVYIPSELGYGERGAGADIPGNSTLIFDMELLAIKPAVEAPKKGN